MVKKINSDEVEIIVNVVNKRIDDILDYHKEFAERAEKKLNHSREIMNDRFDKVDARIQKIEEKNEILSNHQFKIEKLEKDVNNLGSQFKKHLEMHQKELPKTAVNKFKIILIWGILGVIGVTAISVIVTLIINGSFAKIFSILRSIYELPYEIITYIGSFKNY